MLLRYSYNIISQFYTHFSIMSSSLEYHTVVIKRLFLYNQYLFKDSVNLIHVNLKPQLTNIEKTKTVKDLN